MAAANTKAIGAVAEISPKGASATEGSQPLAITSKSCRKTPQTSSSPTDHAGACSSIKAAKHMHDSSLKALGEAMQQTMQEHVADRQLKIRVTHGDIVVAGTDGLFDNFHDSDIEEIVNRGIHEGRLPPKLASDIANFALIASQDKNSMSPFACTAWVNGFNVFGGKIDDITVVVSYIGTK
ncbi:Hydrolase [Sarracenia purpurea var. burkii]